MAVRNYKCLWRYLMMVCLAVGVAKLEAQSNAAMSISEMHRLAHKMVNYSPDSTLVLLDMAAKQIELVNDAELAAKYRAANNLRKSEYYLFYNLEKSEAYLRNAMDYYVSHEDNGKLAEAYCQKSQIIKIKGKALLDASRESLPYLDTALVYAVKQDDAELLTFIHYERALALQQSARWNESFESVLQGVHYAELSGDSLSMAMAYFLMGRTYRHFGFYSNSEYYLAEAVNYGKGLNLYFQLILSYANALQDNQKLELAMENWQRALEITLEQDRWELAIKIYTSIGLFYLEEKDFEKAEEVYFAINKLRETVEYDLPVTLLFIAKIHRYYGNDKEELAYLERIRKNSNQLFLGDYNIYKGAAIPYYFNIYKEAADLYLELGLPWESARLYQKWGAVKDSLELHTNRTQLGQFESMYLKERAKNDEISANVIELERSRKLQAILGIALIAFLIVGGNVTYYIRMRGVKENQKLKFALKTKQLEQLIEGQESERQRIAKELHDGIGQSLAALKLQMQFIGMPEVLEPSVEKVDSLCKEVRVLSHQMMPVVLRENGLEVAIKQLFDHVFENTDLEADLITRGLEERLPEKVEVNLYRITQELLNNILKHSESSKVGMQLISHGGRVVLIVEDNGSGFNKDDKFDGIGLSNIRSRVGALSGKIQIETSKGNGTFVRITIPVSAEVKSKKA